MKFLTKLEVWNRQRKRRNAAKKYKGPLREFVYLDEVSVYSLIASRLGPIAAEFTETQTISLQQEIGGSVGATTGVAKAGIKASIFNNETKGSQVLRKSIVQTTFKELYELEMNSFAIQLLDKEHKLPTHPTDIGDFLTAINTVEYKDWVVNPQDLKRGQLFDLEVELEADGIFRLSTVVATFLEILEEDAEVLGINVGIDFVQVRSIGRIIEKLLVGLIPIRGRAVDYSVVEFGQTQWIIHRKLVDKLPFNSSVIVRPLYIVGVAEQSLFWKDIRLILFSKGRYRALCRLAQDNIQNSWTPVKLTDVFGSLVPGLADQLNLSGFGVITTVADKNKPDQSGETKKQLIRDALNGYVELLVKHYEIDLTSQARDEISLITDKYCISLNRLNERREAFGAIATYLIENFKFEQDSLLLAQYRAVALVEAGLDHQGNPISLAASDVSASQQIEERFLDTEFVAIYW